MELPAQFLDIIRSYGSEAFEALPRALAEEPSVSVRFNRAKGFGPAPGADTVSWCPQGIYLPERPAFTFHPPLHQGAYYVQDASSMFLWHVLSRLTADGRPVRYLDACAAPGGKTTVALDVLPQGSVVVANEYDGRRAGILRENLTKWGAPLHVVTSGDTARFSAYPSAFDIIAADVPCSGEGMMRKDPEAVSQWSPALVEQCVERQREIIANLWPALAPGGYMVYSTCTFNRDENELMVSRLVEDYGAEPVEMAVDPAWGIHGAIRSPYPACRFVPGRIRGEGLFMAVVRKPADDHAAPEAGVTSPQPPAKERKQRKRDGRPAAPALPADIRRRVEGWLAGENRLLLSTDGQTVIAYPAHPFEAHPWQPAVEVAAVRGRDVMPSHALLMSTLLRPGAIPSAEVDAPTAIAYLRGESVSLPGDAPRGIVAVTYGGRPLGAAKNLGSRANNLYPKPWRIITPRPYDPAATALIGI